MAQSEVSSRGGVANGHAKSHGEAGTRCIALIGPYLSGKTSLLEAILARTGAIPRAGSVTAQTSVGDGSPEAREHGMSVSLNVADTTFLGDSFTFLDCPGSVEFQHEGCAALTVCDAAVVVCEADVRRVPALQIIMKQLEDRGIPHFLFLNKIDETTVPLRDLIPMLQPASTRPLVLRQIPIWENGAVNGFVDLASERAFVYRVDAPSEIVELPATMSEREQQARFQMLEQLADHDDELMEQLLSDVPTSRDRVFTDLTQEFRDGVICPVFLGSAKDQHGIFRLLKALRHEVPDVATTAQRLGIGDATSAAHVFKTLHTQHGGKLSVARVLKGEFADGTVVTGPDGSDRIAGVFSMRGEEAVKRGAASAGDTVAFGRLESVQTGQTIGADRIAGAQVASSVAPEAVFAVGLGLKDRKDEVKLTAALAKLQEEDPSLVVESNGDTHQMLLLGQGEMHLRVTLERLQRKYGIAVERQQRQIPYKETIRVATQVRGRHKKQSGGHGQFGDVVLEISPLPRGTGFAFTEKITGGVVPRQFIPSVEIGVKDYLQHGPLGFPVVDVAVTLLDGSYHSVDSSDMAFRQAARLGMDEGLPRCTPVLLEPVMAVNITVPNEATARVNGIISQRRGQILGFDSREGWTGWDVVQAQMPASEMEGLIVDLRSATSGVGTYTARFDHMAELTGRLADQVLAHQRSVAA
ncbi:elongation factor G [Hyphomicrobium sulfonivorans]|uniref:elongation factor G n=1 Tax=Hyphomicrobium sulfonivorans TaxID=121290 RepID=UPI001570E30B|nr:elongation factor G [Hyphomicrobium sulfonivorans]MBI1651201.1 elongation factor G [Hyphomicrobium sulfonivorans]NSL73191.1 elongation factor G [Hyphomicrobium sulfonivorans]